MKRRRLVAGTTPQAAPPAVRPRWEFETRAAAAPLDLRSWVALFVQVVRDVDRRDASRTEEAA